MSLSSEPEARYLESGLHEMQLMPARWPSRVCARAPVTASQILMVQSAATWLLGLVLRVGYHAAITLTATRNPSPVWREFDSRHSSLVAREGHVWDIVQLSRPLHLPPLCPHTILFVVRGGKRVLRVTGKVVIVGVLKICLVLGAIVLRIRKSRRLRSLPLRTGTRRGGRGVGAHLLRAGRGRVEAVQGFKSRK